MSMGFGPKRKENNDYNAVTQSGDVYFNNIFYMFYEGSAIKQNGYVPAIDIAEVMPKVFKFCWFWWSFAFVALIGAIGALLCEYCDAGHILDILC